MRVAVLMAVFNRKEKTLASLRNCYEQIESLKAEGKYTVSIYVSDDGSRDGTPEAISSNYPDVHIIRGNGSLYWNRGMIAAWNEAAKEDYDFYLWLNDDTIMRPGALGVLLDNSFFTRHKVILVGTAVDSRGAYSYGGRKRSGKIIPPDPTIPVVCDIFNGNLVLVPRDVYLSVGTMDPYYSHSFGDFDYGVRAAKAGYFSAVAPGILADCDRNPGVPKWRDASVPLKERIAALRSPKGRPIREQFLYDRRSGNVFFAIAHLASLTLKVFFPLRWKKYAQ